MDPLSLSASIIAVLQATAAVIDYITNVQDASKEQRQLAVEACNLQSLLQRLRFRVDDVRSYDPWFHQIKKLGEPDGPLDQIKTALNTLRAKIASTTKSDRVKHALIWKFEKAELQDLLNRIERLKGLIALALSDDHFTLSQAIHTDVQGIAVGVTNLESKVDREQHRRYAEWLRLPDPSVNYNAAIKKRQAGTGAWLLAKPEYQNWKNNPSSFIWLYGKPGCGKTILSSTVVEDIRSHIATQSDAHVAYFYFDFNDSEKQRVDALIRSLLFQICSSSTFDGLEKLYQSCQDGHVQPKEDALLNLLGHSLEMLSSTYIVVDALDECTQRGDLLITIETLRRDHPAKLHLLATSRPEQDLGESLTSISTAKLDIQSDLVHNDIQSYIDERLKNDSKLRRWPANVQTEIRETLLKKADGMFRWAYCQLESIRPCIKLPKLRTALASLPETLDETYDRILQDIDSNGYLDDAIRMLQWICFAQRPMVLEEMVEVLAIDLDQGSFESDNRLRDPEDLLLICSSLVSSQATRRYVRLKDEFLPQTELRLAHFSVQEYLLSPRAKFSAMFTKTTAHSMIAEASLVYLLHLCERRVNSDRDIEPYPLSMYVGKRWWTHLLQADSVLTPRLIAHLDCLFDPSQQNVLIWSRLHGVDDGNDWSRLPSDLPSNLYYAAAIGSQYLVGRMIAEGADVNAQCQGRYHDPLGAASSKGHESIVRLLIIAGAQVQTTGYCHALTQAVRAGHESVVRLLLDAGASANLLGFPPECALCTALISGHNGILHALVDAGVDLNHPGDHDRPLQIAAREGHLTLVDTLLGAGADPDQGSAQRKTAIHLAAANGHKEVVGRLIEAGADVNAYSNDTWSSSLCVAILKGDEDVVQLLVDAGADVKFQHLLLACGIDEVSLLRALMGASAMPTPSKNDLDKLLCKASSCGKTDVFRHLVELGAEFDPVPTLIQASREGHEKLVKYLIETGTNVNSAFVESDGRCTALSVAASSGHKKVVQMLLAAGADLTVHQGGLYSLLWSALYSDDKDLVRLLIKSGVDVNHRQERDSSQFTSLDIASQTGNAETIQILIDAGATVDATSTTKDGDSDTVLYDSPALFRACARGHTEVVQVLLSAGSDVNKQYVHQGGVFSAVAIASEHGFHQIVELLIKAGADVKKSNTKGITQFDALSAAVRGDHEKTAELLIRAGADVDAYGCYGTARFTPLFIASGEGHDATVRLLINEGAAVNAWSTDGQAKYTALAVATSRGRSYIAQALIAAGADVNAMCKNDRGHDCTALYIACDHTRETIAKLLIDAGAEVNTICYHHKLKQITALGIAWYRARSQKLVRMLQAAGANMSAHTDHEPNTSSQLQEDRRVDGFPNVFTHISSRPCGQID